VTNLLLCLLSLVISAILAKIIWQQGLIDYLNASGDIDLLINIDKGAIANNIYAGSFSEISVYAQVPWLMYVQRLFLMLAQMNLGLAVFNLIPVPPLDGYRVLDQFVFKGRLNLNPQTMMYIHIGFLVVCMSGMLTGLLYTVNSTVMGAFTAVISMMI
jgi:Zn-dependent protease